MNPNPMMGAAPAAGPAGGGAKDALNVPSILLLVTGGIGGLYGLFSLVMAAVGGGANADLMRQLGSNPQLQNMMAMQTGAARFVVPLLWLVISGFLIFGAMKMRNAQSYGLALASAIVAMIPCGGCCCVGLPVGIWALVILLKPEIKAQFSA